MRTELNVYPLLFYFPETSLGIGATAVLSFHPGGMMSERPSQIQTGLAYTLNKQILLYTFYDLFVYGDRDQVYGELGYYDYFYPFYGIGNNTLKEDLESYYVRYPRIQVNALRGITEHLKAGLGLAYDEFNIYSVEDVWLLEQSRPLGWEGSKIMEAALILRYDSRDKVNSPQHGILATVSQTVSVKGVATSDYTRTLLDLSVYRSIGKHSVLALNADMGFQQGEPPFQQLLELGGPKKARGIIKGRYRAMNRNLLQAELRQGIYRRWSMVFFGSAGTVGDSPNALTSNRYHLNAGTGVRFLLQPESGLNIRLDAALGDSGIQFYLSVGEAY